MTRDYPGNCLNDNVNCRSWSAEIRLRCVFHDDVMSDGWDCPLCQQHICVTSVRQTERKRTVEAEATSRGGETREKGKKKKKKNMRIFSINIYMSHYFYAFAPLTSSPFRMTLLSLSLFLIFSQGVFFLKFVLLLFS